MPEREETLTSFTCPRCATTSWHPMDVRQQYCAQCHWWTGDPTLGPRFSEAKAGETFTTRTGRVLTNDDIAVLVDEAEQGYITQSPPPGVSG